MFLVLHPKIKNRLSFVSHETLLNSVVARALADFLSLLISLSLPFAQTIFGTNREKALELRAFFIDFSIPETLDITGFSDLPLQIRPKTGFSVFVMTYTTLFFRIRHPGAS